MLPPVTNTCSPENTWPPTFRSWIASVLADATGGFSVSWLTVNALIVPLRVRHAPSIAPVLDAADSAGVS